MTSIFFEGVGVQNVFICNFVSLACHSSLTTESMKQAMWLAFCCFFFGPLPVRYRPVVMPGKKIMISNCEPML